MYNKTFKWCLNKLTVIIVAVMSLAFAGCNQEDDVFEIFDSGTWRVNNYYSKCNWNNLANKPGVPAYTNAQELEIINSYTILFDDDGTFTGKIDGGTFKGKWSANADDRSFCMTDISADISLSGKNKEFIDKLKYVRYYQGDSRTMQLAPEDRTSYIQFRHDE